MNGRSVALLSALVAGAVVAQVGCGGDSNPQQPPDAGPDANLDGGGDGNVGIDSGSDGGDGAAATVLPGPSHGSSVAISPDDTLAVIVNRDVGSITVLKLTLNGGAVPTASPVTEVAVGGEPWQVVISPDSATAYVVLRKDQKIVKVTGLKGTPTAGASAAVGSEPTGVALTPTGASAFVTNWVDGTVSVIDTASMAVKSTIDLNAALVATGYLGTTTSRPALAHPRSVAITNNLDTNDQDESAYVTEYFGQATAPEAADGSNSETRKVGVVYKIKVSDSSVKAINLAALADMGFKDENGAATSCYPNQVQSITVNGKFAYVVSVCASPKGPTGPRVTAVDCTAGISACTIGTAPTGFVDPVCVKTSALSANPVCVDVASVKTTTAPLVSVIDTTTDSELASASASLNAKFRDLYVAGNVADNGARKYPLVANDMVFVPGSSVGYVSANGADAVFRVRYDATTGNIAEVGASTGRFLDLNPAGIAAKNAGLNPTGLAVGTNGAFLLTASETTRIATVLDLSTQAISGGAAAPAVASLSALPAPDSDGDHVLKGKRFFNTGMARWSLKGQGWGACQSCHIDGLTDNVTWYFARGPRQSTSLDGTFNKNDPTDQRVLNWTAINDELADFEGNTRGVSGGVGAIVSADTVPPATADRIDVTTPCAAPPCTNGQGNIGLNGSSAKAASPSNPLGLAAASTHPDWSFITRYVQTIRSPRAPSNLDAAKVAAGGALFTTDGKCQGCHGGPKWTLSKVAYDPTPANMVALKSKAWPALNGLPAPILPSKTAAGQVMRFSGADPTKAAAFDQIICVLRNVGTFGVAEAAAGIAEIRIDMTTKSQGAGDANGDGAGYNVPSLLGLSTGAPYYHAGSALTLESSFLAKDAGNNFLFKGHHQSLAPNFLTDTDPVVLKTKVDQLVAFLLSIDGTTSPATLPALGSSGGDFCTGP